jgi:acetoacetyl-[acyl-carrier protein] synthase
LSRLPVIVGFGGVNPAGRSSSHHGYRRMVIDELSSSVQDKTFAALAALMNRTDSTSAEARKAMLDHTLVRRLETNLFDANSIPLHKRATIKSTSDQAISFSIKRNHLPDNIPDDWIVDEAGDGVIVSVSGDLDLLFNDTRSSRVLAAGQLPTGF